MTARGSRGRSAPSSSRSSAVVPVVSSNTQKAKNHRSPQCSNLFLIYMPLFDHAGVQWQVWSMNDSSLFQDNPEELMLVKIRGRHVETARFHGFAPPAGLGFRVPRYPRDCSRSFATDRIDNEHGFSVGCWQSCLHLPLRWWWWLWLWFDFCCIWIRPPFRYYSTAQKPFYITAYLLWAAQLLHCGLNEWTGQHDCWMQVTTLWPWQAVESKSN